MACNDQFRHVCLKDLENYIKRDEYFSDFSDEEKAIIRKNLGLTSSDTPGYDPIVHLSDYEKVLNAKNQNQLRVGHIYVIQDFQTIYQDAKGNICGPQKSPVESKTYWLFLHPISTSSFDSRVGIFEYGNNESTCWQWTVEYDITPRLLDANSKTYNKGTITFLRDQNNNEAYYDFKNMKFLKTIQELKDFPKSYDQDTYFYTFDNYGMDGSENGWSNNHLDRFAIRNIFLNDTENVNLGTDCHDNVFAGGCKNSQFGYGTFNNVFTKEVENCSGTVNKGIFGSETSDETFKRIDDFSTKYAITKLDEATETFQVKMYEKQNTGNN